MSRIIQLQNDLRNFQKDNLSVDDYFSKLKVMSEELFEARVDIDDGELSLIALNGLDDLYDSFVTSQTTRYKLLVVARSSSIVRESSTL